ncbi:heavy-metal-associated domain-containing protein [Halococcus sp. AFM35]|jgi:copper chaperone|uniref:heavy-metal-associated domain-containing protein n=1 Tax=Halococcus sp. AFM35 TaxID=3421653 RepID=UPI003EBA3715
MTTTITVEGMSCDHCEQTIEEALQGVSGVSNVRADRDSERATIEGTSDNDALVRAVEDAGYDASV